MRFREKKIYMVIGIILLTLGMVACGPAQDPDDEAATATARAQGEPEEAPESEAAEVVAPEQPDAPEVAAAEEFDIYGGLGEAGFETTASGLQIAILEEGDGDMPEQGEVVAVHYTGWLEDGSSFDSSVSRGEPISFALGRQMVIPGWDEGIAMLQVGDTARLIIPSDLAYGEAGRPGIPPNATLIFDVQLIDISEGAPDAPAEVDSSDYEISDTGLQYYDLETGDGPALEVGQVATVHYTVWLEDGTYIDSSLDRGQPMQMLVGGGQNIAGWEEGVMSMHVGGQRQIIIPSELAFGEEGAGQGLIPPNAGLVLELEVLDAQSPPE